MNDHDRWTMWRSAVAVSACAVALFVVAFCVGRVVQANLLVVVFDRPFAQMSIAGGMWGLVMAFGVRDVASLFGLRRTSAEHRDLAEEDPPQAG